MNTTEGSFYTGEYRNLFLENGLRPEAIQQRLEDTWNEMFYGAPDVRLYHTMDEDKGYIVDTGNTDVRTEGMSYGMMMAVQLDKRRSSTGSGISPRYSCSIRRADIRIISPGNASWMVHGCLPAPRRMEKSSSRWHYSSLPAAGVTGPRHSIIPSRPESFSALVCTREKTGKAIRCGTRRPG